MKRRTCWSLIWTCVVIGQPAEAGVFNGTVVCPGTSACAPAKSSSDAAVIINRYGIVHPPTRRSSWLATRASPWRRGHLLENGLSSLRLPAVPCVKPTLSS